MAFWDILDFGMQVACTDGIGDTLDTRFVFLIHNACMIPLLPDLMGYFDLSPRLQQRLMVAWDVASMLILIEAGAGTGTGGMA